MARERLPCWRWNFRWCRDRGKRRHTYNRRGQTATIHPRPDAATAMPDRVRRPLRCWPNRHERSLPGLWQHLAWRQSACRCRFQIAGLGPTQVGWAAAAEDCVARQTQTWWRLVEQLGRGLSKLLDRAAQPEPTEPGQQACRWTRQPEGKPPEAPHPQDQRQQCFNRQRLLPPGASRYPPTRTVELSHSLARPLRLHQLCPS